ncbi:histidinol dehydrogenase [Candidatus Peregrinibacteria bacterium RIFOXYB2_FULL_32_7]|nr:MAG: histidinol dehydrogenase [Candidatus Peregrinibacteria bacterium RIFOXYB2_FULL_32_7]
MIQIYKWSEIDPKIKMKIMRRAVADIDSIKDQVALIIKDVKEKGDSALVDYIRKFDNPDFDIKNLKVSAEDIKTAYEKVNPQTLEMIKKQISISKKFHEYQAEQLKKVENWEIESTKGVITGQRVTPIDAVGLYVPAGKAPLPTVSQILTVTAKAAGVPRIVVVFPPTGDHYEIIVAANEAGATEIYRVGGVAGISALAYGTETIKPVNKIAGPGSPWVQAAKLQVFGQVGIDMLSGPSEAIILADKTANPVYIAADILARCEHGPDSAGVLITDNLELAEQTKVEILKQFETLNRKEYIKKALEAYSALIVVENFDQAIDLTNEYSPEHLEVMIENPKSLLPKLRNAGSIFLGNFAPVAVGDYASGTNHCLPTGNAPKFSSPVCVSMFQKTSEYQILTKEGLDNLKPIVQMISDVEGLDAHKRSVEIRFNEN